MDIDIDMYAGARGGSIQGFCRGYKDSLKGLRVLEEFVVDL